MTNRLEPAGTQTTASVSINGEGCAIVQECVIANLGLRADADKDLTLSDVMGTFLKLHFRGGKKHNTWRTVETLADELGISKATFYSHLHILALWGLVTSYEVVTDRGMHIHYVISEHVAGCRLRVEPMLPHFVTDIPLFEETQLCRNCNGWVDHPVELKEVQQGKLKPASNLQPLPRKKRGGGVVQSTVKGFKSRGVVQSTEQTPVQPTVHGVVQPTVQEINTEEVNTEELTTPTPQAGDGGSETPNPETSIPNSVDTRTTTQTGEKTNPPISEAPPLNAAPPAPASDDSLLDDFTAWLLTKCAPRIRREMREAISHERTYRTITPFAVKKMRDYAEWYISKHGCCPPPNSLISALERARAEEAKPAPRPPATAVAQLRPSDPNHPLHERWVAQRQIMGLPIN